VEEAEQPRLVIIGRVCVWLQRLSSKRMDLDCKKQETGQKETDDIQVPGLDVKCLVSEEAMQVR
jgi:hypothetical protein